MIRVPRSCRIGGDLAALGLRVGLLVLLAVAWSVTVYAQEVSVRAYLSPGAMVGVGQPFVLAVEITGTQSIEEEPEIPDLGAFAQYLGSNTQSSMQMVNGRTSVSLTVQYRFQALTEGTFEIPAFDVSVGGRTHRTTELQLNVAAETPTQGGTRDAPVVAPDDLFVTADATKSRVRDGEPFVVEYRIWTRVDVSSFSFTRVPEPEGFWVEDITPTGQPEVEQVVRDGQQYASAVIRRVALVPTGSGVKTIDPVVLEAQVRVRSDDPFDRFFGARSLFSTRTVPAGIVSDSLTIVVDPLPPGAPEPFSGVVGSLDMVASLDRDSVDANEAVTLTVRVSGDGNIRAVPAPVLALPGDFEVFPPEISESVRPVGDGLSGEKTFEYVLIPRAPGRREIPSLTMSYLDGAADAYRVAESGPLPLTVSGAVVEGPTGLVRGGVAELRRDIRYIHLGAALRPMARPIFEGAAFWLFVILPLVGIAGSLALRRHRDLLEGDVAYARGRAASRVARKRLAEARTLAGGGDARAFYAEVAKALRGLVADKLNLAEAGLQTSDLESELVRQNVSAGTVEELTSCLERCDRQRFAPPGADAAEESRFLERAGRLMTTLDRELGR
jgi:hypothetical protein